MKQIIDLKNRKFKIDSLGFENDVTLLHTWNGDDNKDVQLYRGMAEYETTVKLDSLGESVP